MRLPSIKLGMAVAKPKAGRYAVSGAKGNLGWANPRVFFDFAVGDGSPGTESEQRAIGRVVFELFRSEAPRTVENFRCLCTGEKGVDAGCDRPLHYKGSYVHRIIPEFLIQMGDITRGTGAGGWSIYGETFPLENLHHKHKHTGPGILGMAHAGPGTDSQNSQFYVCTCPAPHLDGVHTVFGKVVSGYDVVKQLQELPATGDAEPLEPVVIADCGQLEEGIV